MSSSSSPWQLTWAHALFPHRARPAHLYMCPLPSAHEHVLRQTRGALSYLNTVTARRLAEVVDGFSLAAGTQAENLGAIVGGVLAALHARVCRVNLLVRRQLVFDIFQVLLGEATRRLPLAANGAFPSLLGTSQLPHQS